jgi:hypothetical protein
VNSGRPGLDQRLRQLVGVKDAAEAGLGIGDDRRHPVGRVVPLRMSDLIRPLESLVDAANDGRHTVGRIQALVRIHLPCQVRVGGDLPAREVDRLESGLDLLHRLIAGQRAERGNAVLRSEEIPEPAGSAFGQAVPNREGVTQPQDVLGGVGPPNPVPAFLSLPGLLESAGVEVSVFHVRLLVRRSFRRWEHFR